MRIANMCRAHALVLTQISKESEQFSEQAAYLAQSIDGGEVEKYFREGRISEIAKYCESDVVNTYRLWLRHELFQGKLTDAALQASETNLEEFIKVRSNAKPHLTDFIGEQNSV